MKRLKRFKLLKRGFWVLLGLAIAGYLGLFWWSHRPLPQIDGQMTAPGLTFPATVIRDEWGVAHIEAANEADGYYALGWTAAQDRLFQIELWRHVAQGRLAEMFGPDVVKFDKLFRTMDFHGGGRRMLAEATPTALKAFAAYTRGVNDYAAARPLPVEFALLGLGWEPLKPQDLTGMVGYMAWSLHYGWNFDPLVESLSVRLGPQKTAELFPSALGEGRGTTQNSRQGGNSLAANNPAPRNAIHAVQTLALKDEAPASHVLPGLFHLTPRERDWQDLLPTLAGSNTWVISPAKSATGQALLANDPHLAHSQPGIWYLAHLKAGDFEAVGTTIAGTPLFVMGHNRRIGWGVTAMMADGGDFFLEKTRPGQGPPQGQGGQPNRLEVMYKGQWVQTTSRREEIKIKGEDSIFMEITTTPHGPLVNHLLDHEPRPVAYQWVYQKTDKTNDLEAVFQLNRAKNWAGFRKAVSGFGGLCLNISYADADGNIGIQTVGSIPRIKGTGTRYRTGWDGSQEWNGYIPFDSLPSVYNPPRGWAANSNNPLLPYPAPYLTAYWEPEDRIQTVREHLEQPGKIDAAAISAMQNDNRWHSAKTISAQVIEAFKAAPPTDKATGQALALLAGWDGRMEPESPAAGVFALYFELLYRNIFSDEFGEEITTAFRAKNNVYAIMVDTVLRRGPEDWFDNKATPQTETRDTILTRTLEQTAAELVNTHGADPSGWKWKALTSITFVHPLGTVKALAPFFNSGPHTVGGSPNTLNKAQYIYPDWKVMEGPSMRLILDFSNLNQSRVVLPTGQSGIPASPHYEDQAPLWLTGKSIPLPWDGPRVKAAAAHTLQLTPPTRGD